MGPVVSQRAPEPHPGLAPAHACAGAGVCGDAGRRHGRRSAGEPAGSWPHRSGPATSDRRTLAALEDADTQPARQQQASLLRLGRARRRRRRGRWIVRKAASRHIIHALYRHCARRWETTGHAQTVKIRRSNRRRNSCWTNPRANSTTPLSRACAPRARRCLATRSHRRTRAPSPPTLVVAGGKRSRLLVLTVAVVGVLWFGTPGGYRSTASRTSKLLCLPRRSPDFYTELEFYHWLASRVRCHLSAWCCC